MVAFTCVFEILREQRIHIHQLVFLTHLSEGSFFECSIPNIQYVILFEELRFVFAPVTRTQTYQIFADLSPITVAKRRAMKPLLQNLQHHHIPYQWGFLFSIRFTFQGTKYSSRSFEQLQNTLQNLHLYNGPSTSPRRRTTSNSPQSASKPGTDRSRQSASKRGRFNSPDLDPPDTMD